MPSKLQTTTYIARNVSRIVLVRGLLLLFGQTPLVFSVWMARDVQGVAGLSIRQKRLLKRAEIFTNAALLAKNASDLRGTNYKFLLGLMRKFTAKGAILIFNTPH